MKVPKVGQPGVLGNLNEVLARAIGSYTIVLEHSDRMEEIFHEMIDIVSHTFVRSLIEGVNHGCRSYPQSCNLIDATLNHSAEFLAHLIESIPPTVTAVTDWAVYVFESPVGGTATGLRGRVDKISECLKILREKGIELPKCGVHPELLGLDPEIDAYYGLSEFLDQPNVLDEIQAIACPETRLRLTRRYTEQTLLGFIAPSESNQ